MVKRFYFGNGTLHHLTIGDKNKFIKAKEVFIFKTLDCKTEMSDLSQSLKGWYKQFLLYGLLAVLTEHYIASYNENSFQENKNWTQMF